MEITVVYKRLRTWLLLFGVLLGELAAINLPNVYYKIFILIIYILAAITISFWDSYKKNKKFLSEEGFFTYCIILKYKTKLGLIIFLVLGFILGILNFIIFLEIFESESLGLLVISYLVLILGLSYIPNLRIKITYIWPKSEKSQEIIKLVLSAFLGASLVAILPPTIAPDIEPFYDTDILIDPYGANYSSAQWAYHLIPEKKYFWSYWGLDLKLLPNCLRTEWLKPDMGRPHESWSYFNLGVLDITKTFDLSDYDGVSFLIKGNIERQPVEFSIYLNNNKSDNYSLYQYYTNDSLLVTSSWSKEKIYFSDLNITPWTEEKYNTVGPKISKDNLENVTSIGFAIKTKGPVENKIWIDEMYLIIGDDDTELLSNFNTFEVNLSGVDGAWTSQWGLYNPL